MQSLTDDTVVCRNPDVVFSEFEGEIMMMNINKGEYYSLDSVAGDIWMLMDTEMSVKSICDAMCNIYDVEREKCLADSVPFLQQMLELQAIKLA